MAFLLHGTDIFSIPYSMYTYLEHHVKQHVESRFASIVGCSSYGGWSEVKQVGA